jgi:hypothetical protein
MSRFDQIARWLQATLLPTFGFFAPWWCLFVLTDEAASFLAREGAMIAFVGVWLLCFVGGGYFGRSLTLQHKIDDLKRRQREVAAAELRLQMAEIVAKHRATGPSGG